LLKQLVDGRTQALKTVQAMSRRGERSKSEPLLFENQLLEAQERLTSTTISREDFQRVLSEIIGEVKPLAKLNPSKKLVFSKSFCEKQPDFERHPQVQWRRSMIELSDNEVANARWG